MGREDQEQLAYMCWVRMYKDLSNYTIHIANERQTSPARGAKLKRMGVKAGVPDIFIMKPTKLYHGLWIELKVHPNKPTKTQLEFIENAKSEGYAAIVCYGADNAITATERYLRNLRVE